MISAYDELKFLVRHLTWSLLNQIYYVFFFAKGTFCNHYFLRMLAMITRGHYDGACHVGQFCLLYLLQESSTSVVP